MNEICNISPIITKRTTIITTKLPPFVILVARRARQLPRFQPVAHGPASSRTRRTMPSMAAGWAVQLYFARCMIVGVDLAHLPSDLYGLFVYICTAWAISPRLCCPLISAHRELEPIHPNLALGVATLGPRFAKLLMFSAPPRLRMSKRRERRTTTGATCGRGTLNEGMRARNTARARHGLLHRLLLEVGRHRAGGSMLHECRSRAWRRSATTAR